MASSSFGRNRYHREIEARWPDPKLEGWDILQLSCGHRSAIHTISRDLTQAHCAECQLASEAHARAIEAVQKQITEKQRAAVALADTVFAQTYGEEDPHAEPDENL